MDCAQVVLCSIDWLSFSLKLHGELMPLEGYVWKEYNSTAVWGERRVLYTDEGDKVCTVLSKPKSGGFLDGHAALLEVANEWLYHGGGPEMILRLLQQSVVYEITGVSRLDLCADFCPNEAQRDIIEGLQTGKFYIKGKQNGGVFWSTNENPKVRRGEEERKPFLSDMWTGRRIPHQQSWGHKTSQIKWKLYYKTKELLDAGGGYFLHKPYIVDQWRIAGMDTTNVWRLEVSVKNLNQLRFWETRLDYNTLATQRGSIYASFVNQFFVVKKDEGHADKSNDAVVPFLPLDDIKGVVRVKRGEGLAEHNGRITLLRHLVKSLDEEEVLYDKMSRNAVVEHVEKIVRRDGLQIYFRAMMGAWLDEWKEDVEARAEGRDFSVLELRKSRQSMPVNDKFDKRVPDDNECVMSEALKAEKQALREKIDALSKTLAGARKRSKGSNGPEGRLSL